MQKFPVVKTKSVPKVMWYADCLGGAVLAYVTAVLEV